MRRLELVSRDLRQITLGDQGVDYVLARRRRRRGVGLKVDSQGLAVTAPATLPLSRIEAFVRESERWILKKLDEWSGKRIPPVAWRDGQELPFLGRSIVLRVTAAAR